MKRREFIAATAALLISLRPSHGQGKRRRLGFLAIGDGSGNVLNQAELAFLDALRNLGWVEGKNLSVEYRFSQPADRLTDSVAELIALRPDILIAPGPQDQIRDRPQFVVGAALRADSLGGLAPTSGFCRRV
jgi:putative tryptophan/tyrosine transport system substrate-binding protein